MNAQTASATGSDYAPGAAVLAAGRLSVYELFREQALRRPDRPAIADRNRAFSYAQLLQRVDALAARLHTAGAAAGDRVAVLAENRIEYIELHLAAARLGVIVACQNWRLHPDELAHCVGLVSPALLFYSDRFAEGASQLAERFQLPALRLDSVSEPGTNTAEAFSSPRSS